ncbi:MAG: LTA synthase family protein [Rhodanobacter sp.]
MLSNSKPPERRWTAPATRIVLTLVLALVFVLFTGLVDGGSGVVPLRLLDQPRYPVANALPGLLFALLMLAWTRRLFLSFGISFALQGVVYAVNGLKVGELGTPLLPADFQMLGQLRKGGLHVFAAYLPHSLWPYLMILLAIVLIAALWRFEPPLLPPRTGGKRLAGGAVAAVLLVSLLSGVTVWQRLYNKQVLWLEPWSASITTMHSGLVSSLLMFHMHYGQGKRKPDISAASALIEDSVPGLQQALNTPSASELPDIVVIQSESLFDPTILRGYESSDFTPNLKRLAAEGSSGPLHVPTFGGGTIRTEFEVLTGLSLQYFSNLQFPYLQLGHHPVPSLVRTLEAHGYETVAVHDNDPAFWNRATAFKALGFDHFVSRSQFPPDAVKDGKYVADSAMTDEVMKLLKDSGPPQFLFAISIEAHGPYDVEPAHPEQLDAIPVPSGISGRAKRELQDYLYHIGHADAQLGRLVAWLAQRKRPSLVLFYGDHLPALVDTYRTAGFVNGKGMLSQAGMWLLVDPKHPQSPVTAATAAWLLPGRLLDRAGIHNDPYFALTQIAGPPLAGLTEATDAKLPPEDQQLQTLDVQMSSIDQLRMNRKLDKLVLRLVASPTATAHGSGKTKLIATAK